MPLSQIFVAQPARLTRQLATGDPHVLEQIADGCQCCDAGARHKQVMSSSSALHMTPGRAYANRINRFHCSNRAGDRPSDPGAHQRSRRAQQRELPHRYRNSVCSRRPALARLPRAAHGRGCRLDPFQGLRLPLRLLGPIARQRLQIPRYSGIASCGCTQTTFKSFCSHCCLYWLGLQGFRAGVDARLKKLQRTSRCVSPFEMRRHIEDMFS